MKKFKTEDVVLVAILGVAITMMTVFSVIENGAWALLLVPLQLVAIAAVVFGVNWALNWARKRDER